MTENQCPQCGAPIDPGAIECKFYGEKLAVQQARQQVQQSQPQPQIAYAQMQPSPQQVYASSINPFWPIKSRILAGLLGIFFGGIGAHKFYMGKIGMGILYLLFCWTGIPACVGFIEGLIYLCSSDENFQLNHHVRIE